MRILLWLACLGAALGAAAAGGAETFADRLLERARQEAQAGVVYDAEYRHIPFPRGDVPPGIGACTDLVVRAFRYAGVDLQEEIYKERAAFPDLYPMNPNDEGNPNTNIDQRRCRHLAIWFGRHALTLTTSIGPEDLAQWRPGDIVFFNLSQYRKPMPDHVGLVSDRRDADGVPFVIDNFPPGAAERFSLRSFPTIHSHFRWPRDTPGPPIEPRYAEATTPTYSLRFPKPTPAPTPLPGPPVPAKAPAASRPASRPAKTAGAPAARATVQERR
ncbi:MAG: DUF1287 domain-containing protein [Candidatus Sumerlaeota bacterium]|nr:DUF1287 domain-containing protein [Candidatus Sumerlaeota bacterium]